VLNTTVAQTSAINVSTTAKVSAGQAQSIARAQAGSNTVDSVSAAKQTVLSIGAPRLAWETVVASHHGVEPSKLHVFVDATSGAVAYKYDQVADGNGTGAINGPNPVHLDTSSSGGTFSMTDPNHTTLKCQDAANNTTFTGPDDNWGNGTATNKETGCVDALFSSQTEFKMLSAWLDRNGPDGNGGAWPLRVGLNDQNAYYDGTQVQIGKNTAGEWIGSLDVVAHEQGHGIDDHTPGGISGGGTQEFVADVFGGTTESYAAEPSPYDVPDWTVGEERSTSSAADRSATCTTRPRSATRTATRARSRAPSYMRRPVRATTGTTCSPSAATRPVSRPAPPATAAAASSVSASRQRSRSSTTRC
jgi:Zn-dependent metalloprotease